MSLDELGEYAAEFLGKLSESEEQEFERLYKTKKDELDNDDFKRDIRNYVNDYEDHLELIQAAISAFPQGDEGVTEYEYGFTEPLSETGQKNGDVLLTKIGVDSVHLCIVECKGGTYNSDWLDKLHNIIGDLSEESIETIKRQLGVEEKNVEHVQLVLLAKSAQASIARRRLDEEDLPSSEQTDDDLFYDSAVWGCDIFSDSIHFEIGDIADKQLSDAVRGAVDFRTEQAPIEYTLGEHCLIQLRKVIFRLVRRNQREGLEHPLEFNEDTFHDVFDSNLQLGCTGGTREQLVKDRSEWLLEKGIEIGILNESEGRLNTDRDYRIIFKGGKPTTAEKATEDKYINHEAQRKLNKRAFELARDDFDTDQRSLSEF